MRHRRGKNRDAKDGSAVKQKPPPRRLCNRCNAEKHDNQPCKVCGSPEYRLGFTLIEALVVLAIAATLVAALASGCERHDPGGEPRQTRFLFTVKHDDHLFVTDAGIKVLIHHPNCPCQRRRLNAEEE